MTGNGFENLAPCSRENEVKISKKRKMANLFWPFQGYQKWHFGCPKQTSETTFQYKLAPKTPKKPP